MLNILKKTKYILLVLLTGLGGLSLNSIPASAIYCSNCSTVWNQMKEYVEAANTQLNTAKQLQTQLQQYQDMIKQGLSFSSPEFDGLSSTLNQLKQVYNSGQSLSHNMENVNSEFEKMYPGYDDYLKKAEFGGSTSQYKSWSEKGLSNSRVAIEAAGINTSSFDDEDKLMQKLVDRSTSAQGRMQAIQAGNEIAAQQVKQMQLLRDLMANNVTLQANYTADVIEKQAQQDAIREKFFEPDLVNTKRGTGF